MKSRVPRKLLLNQRRANVLSPMKIMEVDRSIQLTIPIITRTTKFFFEDPNRPKKPEFVPKYQPSSPLFNINVQRTAEPFSPYKPVSVKQFMSRARENYFADIAQFYSQVNDQMERDQEMADVRYRLEVKMEQWKQNNGALPRNRIQDFK